MNITSWDYKTSFLNKQAKYNNNNKEAKKLIH